MSRSFPFSTRFPTLNRVFPRLKGIHCISVVRAPARLQFSRNLRLSLCFISTSSLSRSRRLARITRMTAPPTSTAATAMAMADDQEEADKMKPSMIDSAVSESRSSSALPTSSKLQTYETDANSETTSSSAFEPSASTAAVQEVVSALSMPTATHAHQTKAVASLAPQS